MAEETSFDEGFRYGYWRGARDAYADFAKDFEQFAQTLAHRSKQTGGMVGNERYREALVEALGKRAEHLSHALAASEGRNQGADASGLETQIADVKVLQRLEALESRLDDPEALAEHLSQIFGRKAGEMRRKSA